MKNLILHVKSSGAQSKFAVAVAFTVLASLLSVLAARLLGAALVEPASLSAVAFLFAAMLGAYLFDVLSDRALVKTAFRLNRFWRFRLTNLILNPKDSYDHRFSSEDLAARATVDCEGIEQELVSSAQRLLMLFVSTLTMLLGMAFLSLELSILLGFSCLIPLFAPVFARKKTVKIHHNLVHTNGNCAQRAREFLDGWQEIDRFAAQNWGSAKMSEAIRSHERVGNRSVVLTSTISAVTSASSYLPVIASLIYGLINFDSVALPIWIAFVKIAFDLSAPLRACGDEIQGWQILRGKLVRLLEAVDFEPKQIQAPEFSPARGSTNLVVRGLVVKPRKFPVAMQLPSLEARGGEVIAVIGPSGSGKSCLLRSLSGEFDTRSGEVAITAPDNLQKEAIYFDDQNDLEDSNLRDRSKNRAIIVCDEPFDNFIQLKSFIRNFKRQFKDRVLIIASHEQRIIEDCHQVFFMKDRVLAPMGGRQC